MVMCEILFKGQRKDTGQWIEGDLHRYGPEAFIFSCLDFPDGADWYEVDPATVTADMSPVVLCKDCRHFRRNLENDTYCGCVGGLTDPEEHDFCSYGEKRGEGK